MSQSYQCLLCKHFNLASEGCAAFPLGIPEEILSGQHDHRKAYDGDGGIRWEPADDEAAELSASMDEEDEGEPGA